MLRDGWQWDLYVEGVHEGQLLFNGDELVVETEPGQNRVNFYDLRTKATSKDLFFSVPKDQRLRVEIGRGDMQVEFEYLVTPSNFTVTIGRDTWINWDEDAIEVGFSFTFSDEFKQIAATWDGLPVVGVYLVKDRGTAFNYVVPRKPSTWRYWSPPVLTGNRSKERIVGYVETYLLDDGDEFFLSFPVSELRDEDTLPGTEYRFFVRIYDNPPAVGDTFNPSQISVDDPLLFEIPPEYNAGFRFGPTSSSGVPVVEALPQ